MKIEELQLWVKKTTGPVSTDPEYCGKMYDDFRTPWRLGLGKSIGTQIRQK